MNTLRFFALFLVVVSLAWLVGCSTNNSTVMPPAQAPSADVQALQQAVATVDSVAAFSNSDQATIDDGGLHADEYQTTSAGSPDFLLGAVSNDSLSPVRWGRHITNVTQSYAVDTTGDTLATVTITQIITGELRIGLGTHRSDTTVVDTVVKKPFTLDIKRKVLFRRVARTNNPLRNWMPVAVTMAEGTSQNTNDFSISSVEITDTHQHYDSTFTDPLNSWFALGLFRGCVPRFHGNDSLTVRVTIASADSSNELVYLRHDIAGDRHHPGFGRAKMNLVSVTGTSGNYTRVYSRTLTTHFPSWGLLEERFNVMVDVLSYGTIYDNNAPYSNEIWGAPYMTLR